MGYDGAVQGMRVGGTVGWVRIGVDAMDMESNGYGIGNGVDLIRFESVG